MSEIGVGGGSRRVGYRGGVMLARLTDAGIVASVWRKKGKRRPSVYEIYLRNRLRDVTNTLKLMHEREQAAMREAIQVWNREHQGMRGSAAVRLEDIQTARMYGHLLAIMLPNGRTLYHVDAIYSESRRLDWLRPMVGSLLVRTEQGWRPTVNCKAGYVLRYVPDSRSYEACDLAHYAEQKP